VRDRSGLAGVPHRPVSELLRVLDPAEPREQRPLSGAVLRRAGVEEQLHQPLGHLHPARLASPATAFDRLRPGEDARGLDVDVAPGEGDVLPETAAVLLQEGEEQPPLPRTARTTRKPPTLVTTGFPGSRATRSKSASRRPHVRMSGRADQIFMPSINSLIERGQGPRTRTRLWPQGLQLLRLPLDAAGGGGPALREPSRQDPSRRLPGASEYGRLHRSDEQRFRDRPGRLGQSVEVASHEPGAVPTSMREHPAARRAVAGVGPHVEREGLAAGEVVPHS
jgi:hypothetical protein